MLPAQNSWAVSPSEAVAIQKRLRSQVRLRPFHQTIHSFGGADISFNRFSTTAYAVFVVLHAQTYARIAESTFIGELTFPYIPGLLSFREIPLLLEAWKKLRVKPDLLLMDGQGIAHPRRLGIASHFGVITDFPTIGCAKSKLVGHFDPLGNEPGSYSLLKDKNEDLGFAFRTKKNKLPLFISPGHLVDIPSALQIFQSMPMRYRIPEPTRQAHLFANELRIRFSKPNQTLNLVK